MGYPLDDIAIYFDGAILRDQKRDNPYRVQANYISDLYHIHLNGYKPPKTGRICLHLVPNILDLHNPIYTGCLLSCYALFDEENFVSKSNTDQQLILINILHETIINVARNFRWNEAVFIVAYSKCIENDFRFLKEYPSKKSRDRSLSASVVIQKNQQTTYTYIKVASATDTKLHKVFETRNYYCYDLMYSLAKRGKWIDKGCFGFTFKSNKISIFFSKRKTTSK